MATYEGGCSVNHLSDAGLPSLVDRFALFARFLGGRRTGDFLFGLLVNTHQRSFLAEAGLPPAGSSRHALHRGAGSGERQNERQACKDPTKNELLTLPWSLHRRSLRGLRSSAPRSFVELLRIQCPKQTLEGQKGHRAALSIERESNSSSSGARSVFQTKRCRPRATGFARESPQIAWSV
jgi:hypothetical protein